MIDPKDIHSLSDFQRNTKGHIRRLKKSGRPAVLTVNGKAALVVLDIDAYKSGSGQFQGEAEVEAVLKGLAQMRAGLGRPIEEFEREFKARRLAARKHRRKSA